MADRLDDAADLAVTELRRKARRRLVGAVVLALAAAILLPLLLESDPRPLGDAVSIQIPPVDNDKFVSRLSPAAPKGKDAKSEAKPGASQAPSSSGGTPVAGSAATSTPATASPSTSPSTGKAAPPSPAAVAPAPPTAVSASVPIPASAPVASGAAPIAEPSSQPAPAAVAQAGSATTSQTPPPGASLPPPGAQAPPAGSTEAAGAPAVASPESSSTLGEGRKPGSFVIQLAAFTDDKGANALANRVRKEGFPAYTEPYRTKTGTLWRVRVGGYLTRAEANDALASLKSAGHKGLVSVVR